MINKWSLYDRSEALDYRFKSDSFLELLADFIVICKDTGLSSLRKKNDPDPEGNFSEVLNEFLSFLERLRADNGRNLYPRVSTYGIYNFGPDMFDYYFDSSIYAYNRLGQVSKVIFTPENIREKLTEIGHGQMNYTGLSAPFEFDIYIKLSPNRQVEGYDFLINLNSDIWLEKVPCIHCSEDYWQDNAELCRLNRVSLNIFLQKMMTLCDRYNGIAEPDFGTLHLYRDKISTMGLL